MFGVEAQLRLVQSEWPASLCEHPLCSPQTGPRGEILWHGIRVNIGISWGPAQREKNSLTQRYDYTGSTVTAACSVLSALGHGGLTGVTQAVVDAVGLPPYGPGEDRALAFLLEDDLKVYMGPMSQRDEEDPVHVILPWALMARREVVPPQPLIPSEPSDAVPQMHLVLPLTPPSPWSCFSVDASDSYSGGSATSLGLSSGMGTCATVRGKFSGMVERDVEGGISQLLGAVECAALRTQGQMVCVVSALCNVAWNAAN
eukprot:Hpha_TRINITY_DN16066_c3_g5::TRINITY_DN16066_c3_g5_i1::g.119891::m.119891